VKETSSRLFAKGDQQTKLWISFWRICRLVEVASNIY